MATMSMKDALAAALKELHALSADELRAELNLNRNGSLAVALREAQEFLFNSHYSAGYPISKSQPSLDDDLDIELLRTEVWCKLWAANDNSYALAA
jgi:hypothetical protein